jgi:hypothetical protein
MIADATLWLARIRVAQSLGEMLLSRRRAKDTPDARLRAAADHCLI